jgi:hypothetical protein
MDLMDAFNQSGIFAKLGLLVGFGPPGLAIAYVLRPGERKLAIMRPVSLAAIFAAICGLVAELIAVLMGVAATLPRPVHVPNVYVGVSEAFVPPFVNFGLLAAAWLLVAVGMTRRARAWTRLLARCSVSSASWTVRGLLRNANTPGAPARRSIGTSRLLYPVGPTRVVPAVVAILGPDLKSCAATQPTGSPPEFLTATRYPCNM